MSLFAIFFSFQSFVFLIGINFLSKRLSTYLKLNKNFNLSIFSTLILIISFCFYFLNSFNFFYLKKFSEFIFYFFIFLGYFSFIFKFLNLKKKNKKELFHWNYLNIIYFIIIINILISSLVPVTDADSVRYHLGQFNNDQKFIDFDLHNKISYIGDGLNVISYYSGALNIVSCLNFYFLFLVISIIKKTFSKEKKIFFSLFLLSIPIYLNLLISQKPFLWLILNLFYIFFLNYKNLINKNSFSFLIILINLSLILISKPEFLLVVPLFVIFLIVKNISLNFIIKKKFSRIFLFIACISLFPTTFFIYNFFIFSDPTKILLIQNNIGEEKFISFLKNSNISISLSNAFEFFFNLGLPTKYIKWFSISLGFGFLICIIFSQFKFNKNYIFLISLIIINFLFDRINIEENHSRNYIFIFLILIYLFLQQKIIFKNFVKIILIIQLIITQVSFMFFNYEIYVKNNYKEIAYNYSNENKIFEKMKLEKNSIIITNIDGNLFKRYDYVNIDYYNFDKSFFYEKFYNKIKNDKKINEIILILKESDTYPVLNKYLREELLISLRTRNPLKKKQTINYSIYKLSKKEFGDSIKILK